MKRFTIIFFTLAGIILASGLLWLHHVNQPCLQLYGVESSHDSTDAFISCEQSNMANIFAFQFFAVLGIMCVAVTMITIELMTEWWQSRPRRC